MLNWLRLIKWSQDEGQESECKHQQRVFELLCHTSYSTATLVSVIMTLGSRHLEMAIVAGIGLHRTVVTANVYCSGVPVCKCRYL